MKTQLYSFPTAAYRPLPTVTTAELDADPHGLFARYRSETPFLRRTDGPYIALRAADVAALITDPRTRQMETEMLRSRGITSGPLFDLIGNSMLFANGEVHRRRRAPMSRAFAFRIMSAIRPHIRTAADKLIDVHFRTGAMNLIDHYSALIPAGAIANILGLPEDDAPTFTAWVYSLFPRLQCFIHG